MAEPTKKTIRFIRFSQELPKFKETKPGEMVEYGADNLFPSFLTELYMKSATHASIVNSKVRYLNGKGWTIPEKGLNTLQLAQAQKFIYNVNKYQTLESLTREAFNDLEIQNGVCFEIIWHMNKETFDICYLPWRMVRTNADQTKFWISNDWGAKKAGRKFESREAVPFDRKNPVGKQILYMPFPKPFPDGYIGCYTYPEYQAAIPWIETDTEIANYHRNNTKQGFTAGAIITFTNGIPSEEEAAVIERQIKRKLTGTDNAGEIVVQFADDATKVPVITRLSGGDLDKQFETLLPLVNQSIFVGHQVTDPELFGVKPSGGGVRIGRSEKREAYEQFQNTYITPRQQFLESIINGLAEAQGLPVGYRIIQTEPIGMEFSEAVITQFLTREEVGKMLRDRLGLDDSNTQSEQAFAKQRLEHKDVQIFRKYGRNRAMYRRHSQYNLRFANEKGAELQEIESLELARQEMAAADVRLNEFQRSILNILGEDSNNDAGQIATALKKNVTDVSREIDFMQSKGILNNVKGKITVTKTGYDTLAQQSPRVALEVLYEYAVAPGMGQTLLSTSREFCVDLIKADLLYSREDINKISAEVGYDVWAYRGGWYTNPSDGFSYPACRHIWRQVVVSKM